MAVNTYTREASKDEMAREIDRRGAVIEVLEARAEKAEAERDEALRNAPLSGRTLGRALANKAAADAAKRNADLEAEVARLREALTEARRAIGDHFAPNDCYATGPLTGDPIRDLIECPACTFLKLYDRAALAQEPKP